MPQSLQLAGADLHSDDYWRILDGIFTPENVVHSRKNHEKSLIKITVLWHDTTENSSELQNLKDDILGMLVFSDVPALSLTS